MRIPGEMEKSRLYAESHSKNILRNKFPAGPCITISRETGTSAKLISEELVSFFKQKHGKDTGWKIFDKNLIEKVLEEYHLPSVAGNLLEEEKISFFSSMLNEIFSGLPGQWTLIHKTEEKIFRLAASGNVIIIGRGANIITSSLSNSFHVRIIAPLSDRIKNFAEIYRLDCKEARQIVEQHDMCRMKYLYSVFNRKIDDPSLYNLTINTRGLTFQQAAAIIGSAVVHKFPDLFNT